MPEAEVRPAAAASYRRRQLCEELELLEGPPSTDADWEAPMLRTRVAEADVASVLEQWTGIPSERMLAAEAEKILSLPDALAARVKGQPVAVEAVAGAFDGCCKLECAAVAARRSCRRGRLCGRAAAPIRRALRQQK